MEIFRYTPGRTPLLVSIPHSGTHAPEEIRARFSPAAAALPDTDWHVHVLYDFAAGLGAHVLAANYSRYVVDLNRDPSGKEMYPGLNNTGIVPAETFGGENIYREGDAPDAREIAERIAKYWQPYHDKISETLQSIKTQHGHAVLFDAHSIPSRVPRLFPGELPQLNLGTNNGASCDKRLAESAWAILNQAGYTTAFNGRFKGGHITRYYGRPEEGFHTLQLELVQTTYMDESAPWNFREDKASRLRPALKTLLETLAGWKAT